NVDYREDDQPAGELAHTQREERQANADQAVSAHFQQHARQDHADLRWRIRMCVWQPGMEREHGDLDRKGHEDQQECQQLQAHRHANERDLYAADNKMGREVLHACRVSAALEVEQQDTGQHKDTAEEGVQQELPGRIDASRHAMLEYIAAPDTDQQEHRGQLDLPEEEEEQQIERQEDAHHARLQD